MEEKKAFTHAQLDALKEIGNIGAGNAATSMSRLINKKVDMQVPSVKIIAFDEVMELVGGAETPVAGILIHINGDVPGKVYFILSMNEAASLIASITGQEHIDLLHDTPPNEMVVSLMKEVGNILTGSYLTALSDFTGLSLIPSVPFLSIDMAGAVLSAGLIDVSAVTDYAIIIDTQMFDGESEDGITGNFLFLRTRTRSTNFLIRWDWNMMTEISTVIKVGIADLNIVHAPDKIRTSGLGSCVGVVIYDLSKQLAGLGHVMLPDSSMAKRENLNIYKYADSAVDILVERLLKAGGRKPSLNAKIAGGAQMFQFTSGSDFMRIGPRNSAAVEEGLKVHSIPIVAKDVGGSNGRTIEFDPVTGMLNIRTISAGEAEI